MAPRRPDRSTELPRPRTAEMEDLARKRRRSVILTIALAFVTGLAFLFALWLAAR